MGGDARRIVTLSPQPEHVIQSRHLTGLPPPGQAKLRGGKEVVKLGKLVLCLVLLSAVAVAACGESSDSATTAATPTSARTRDPGPTNCEDVSLGNIEGQNVSAVDIEAIGVDCVEAEEVAAQWAAQQVGGPSAKLPAGWHCASDCHKGSARVSFTLSYAG